MQSRQNMDFEDKLCALKRELSDRLERINSNLRRGVDADSEERAKQLEDKDVVDALGNEAREELAKVTAALDRLAAGKYGVCGECGGEIAEERLLAQPHAEHCIACANS